MKVTMTLTKNTKNTFVYTADTDESDNKIPQLYIKKSAFGEEIAPVHITVTIEEGQE